MEETEELKQAKMQTPIEIALGVDENGMTTASKLYSFLELNPSNYSKWCKTNITENEFAEENGDTVRRVERSIRRAIEVTWTNGNTNAINKIFGYTVSVEKGKPTNSEFIALITDFVSLYGDEIANGSYKW